MIKKVFPLDAPLSSDIMLERLERFAHCLRATNVWRTPKKDARFCILTKANIGTGEFPAHAGSLALADLLLPEAYCVRRLRDAGCDVFGTTTMTELAGFVTTRASEFGYSQLGGLPKNPHGPFPTRGSSAGSAAAVAAGLCDAALGRKRGAALCCRGLPAALSPISPVVALFPEAALFPFPHTLTPRACSRARLRPPAP